MNKSFPISTLIIYPCSECIGVDCFLLGDYHNLICQQLDSDSCDDGHQNSESESIIGLTNLHDLCGDVALVRYKSSSD